MQAGRFFHACPELQNPQKTLLVTFVFLSLCKMFSEIYDGEGLYGCRFLQKTMLFQALHRKIKTIEGDSPIRRNAR